MNNKFMILCGEDTKNPNLFINLEKYISQRLNLRLIYGNKQNLNQKYLLVNIGMNMID